MSQSDIRTFKAATIQEAIEMVRRELGPEAVILQTRELPQPKFFRWRKVKERIEVTAGKGVNVRIPKAVSSAAPRRSAAATTGETGNPVVRRPADDLLAPPPALLPRPAPVANPPKEPPRLPPNRIDSHSTPAAPLPREAGLGNASSPPVVNRLVAESPDGEAQNNITRQLNTIQQMMSQLTRNALHAANDVPTELFQLYAEMIDVEVEEDLARELTQKLKNLLGDATSDLNLAKSRLRAIVESEIRCAPPIAAKSGTRRVVALVGPTGVGKTTTIAKLAANFRLRDGIRMGLVTVDTYRIAAVEQLRTYAEIIDLPMKVVTTPREMRRALDELAGLDLVLIDTAGRSPRDELKIQELKSLLSEAQVDEVHLVLSLAASARSLQATAEKFAAAGTTSLILTKLDEAIGLGSLISVARRIPLPVSYLTTGQDVPDDIEHALPGRIAALSLGSDSLLGRRRDNAPAF
jgi:flagellar biosynthesis protein FlhF